MRWVWLGGAVAFGLVGTSLQEQRPGPVPTFHAEIAPLIRSKCTPCHRPGGPAPFSLSTYEECKRRGELIRYVTLIRYMPPTDAESDFGPIALHEPISDSEGVLLQKWFQAGMPEGARKPELAPKVPAKWPMGEPDVILRNAQPIAVDVEGSNYWQVSTVNLAKHAGRPLRAFDFRPASPQALKSATLAFDIRGTLAAAVAKSPLNKYRTAGSMMIGADGLIGAWAPGYAPWSLPKGVALAPSKAATIAVQAQYRPTGKREDGGFEIALYLEKDASARVARWTTLGRRDFRIEPGDSPVLEDSVAFDSHQEALAVMPEARFFASHIHVGLEQANGASRTLLRIRSWDPNWAGAYRLARPAKIAPGERIVARVGYDNDKHSVRNEGKTPRLVKFGHSLDDEIFWVHVLTAPAAGAR